MPPKGPDKAIYNDRDLVFICAMAAGFTTKRAGELFGLSERGTYKYIGKYRARLERGRDIVQKLVSEFRSDLTAEAISKERFTEELEKRLGLSFIGLDAGLKRGDVSILREYWERLFGKVPGKLDAVMRGQIEHMVKIDPDILAAISADVNRDKALMAARPLLSSPSEAVIDVEPG